jgi:hypothetical protein
MGFLIFIVIVETITIFLLLIRKPKTITIREDISKNEQLKYQEFYAEKTRELDKQLSEEKRKSIDLIHATELESLTKISEKEQALVAQIRERENNLNSEIRIKENQLAKEYEELKNRLDQEHIEFIEMKNSEFVETIQKIENEIVLKSDAAVQKIKEYETAIQI